MHKVISRYLFLVLLGLFSIAWSGCRSTPQIERAFDESEEVLTASATADITIVDRGTPRLTQVRPVPAHITISPGETITLSGLAFDQLGREIEGAVIQWQAIDPEVGTITPRGVFRAGFTKGTFGDSLVVTARAPAGMAAGLVQAAASVTVDEFIRELVPARIVLFPEAAEVEPEGTFRLTAMALDSNGLAIPDVKFKWEMIEPLAGSISRDNRLVASSNIGTFPKAIRVTLIPEEDGRDEPISATMDILVTDPADAANRVSASVLPRVVSLTPGDDIRFSALLLDKKGNQITATEHRWEVLDDRAGVITNNGRFQASNEAGIYPDVVRVTISIQGADETVTAIATVAIIDVSLPTTQESAEAFKVAIFPERIVLSPGESTRVSIVTLGGDVRFLSGANVDWSLSPPEVGEVSQFVNVTAHDFPGVYEGAIRARVTLDTEGGPLTTEVSATLVIRDVLNNVQITPEAATVARGNKVQFRAVARDKSGVLVPDVTFRWKINNPEEGPAVGTIDPNGLFTVEGDPGTYPGTVEVQAIQRIRPSGTGG